VHRPNDILDRLLALIFKRRVNLAFDFTKYLVAYQDAPRVPKSLQPRRDVYAFSVNISALLNDHVTKVETYPKLQRRTGHLRLDRESTPRRRYWTCELSEKPIARRLDQPPLMLIDLRLDDLPPQLLHLSECAFLVALHRR
jgi:hypothetical protein